MLEKLNDDFLRTNLKEYTKFLEEEKKLHDELERELEKLSYCEDEDEKELIKEIINNIKQDILWNVSVQTQLLEKMS